MMADMHSLQWIDGSAMSRVGRMSEQDIGPLGYSKWMPFNSLLCVPQLAKN